MCSCSFSLYLGVQFVDIISHAQQKNLQFYFGFSAEKKSLKLIVVFQNAECPFYLDGSVHPIQDPLFAHDIFIRFPSLFHKLFGYIQLFVPLRSGAFFFIRTAATVFTLIYSHLRYITTLTFAMTVILTF